MLKDRIFLKQRNILHALAANNHTYLLESLVKSNPNLKLYEPNSFDTNVFSPIQIAICEKFFFFAESFMRIFREELTYEVSKPPARIIAKREEASPPKTV